MSLPKVKAFLTLLMAIGAAAFFGGGGTFASFSAETTNPGSTAASGTLTMTNTVGTSGSPCASNSATTQNNFNEVCSPVLTLTNLAPGTYGGTQKVAIQNTGSIDASALSLWAPPVNASLNSALTSGVSSGASLTVTPLEGTVQSGDSIVVSYGSNVPLTFQASGPAAAGATSIPVTAKTPTATYPVGSTVQDTSSNTTASNTDCYDVKTTVAGTTGATKGTDLNFNPTTGNPLCAAALLYVQEQTGGFNYCWFGNSSNAPTGGCTAPISVNPSSSVSAGAINALPVTALNGNVKSGDTLKIVSGNNTQTLQATGDAYIGAVSIPTASQTANFTFPTTATITDTTVQNTLNPDQADTISKFDTLHNGSSGKIPLYPLTANGTASTTAPVALAHSATRTFYVGVYLPGPPANNQNPLQGLSSTFGLTWHLDQ